MTNEVVNFFLYWGSCQHRQCMRCMTGPYPKVRPRHGAIARPALSSPAITLAYGVDLLALDLFQAVVSHVAQLLLDYQ